MRYWEQEFAQLKPIKRRGNRRYYQQHEVLLIRRIRELLYDEGFTINGARNRLAEAVAAVRPAEPVGVDGLRTDSSDLELPSDEAAATRAVSGQLPATGMAATLFAPSAASLASPASADFAASAALHDRSERSSACVEMLDLRSELQLIRDLLSA